MYATLAPGSALWYVNFPPGHMHKRGKPMTMNVAPAGKEAEASQK